MIVLLFAAACRVFYCAVLAAELQAKQHENVRVSSFFVPLGCILIANERADRGRRSLRVLERNRGLSGPGSPNRPALGKKRRFADPPAPACPSGFGLRFQSRTRR